ncbi:MAG: sensor histidine kinase, partial [Planctomycetota bacterium]
MASTVDDLIAAWFNDPARIIHLDDGEVLLSEGASNDRLYLVRVGHLRSIETETAHTVIHAEVGDLVGVQSFFVPAYPSVATMVSSGASELSWVAYDQVAAVADPAAEFMPLVLQAMTRRQQVIYQLMEREQQAEARARELEAMSQLGQFAAGVAHELNNALAVIGRGTEWLGASLNERMAAQPNADYLAFQVGYRRGRQVSSADARARQGELAERFRLVGSEARRLAQAGFSEDELQQIRRALSRNFASVLQAWELGATFHDVATSAEHGGAVIESMKNLGARASLENNPIDLRDSVEAALCILRNVSRGIRIVYDDVPVGVSVN